MRRFGLATHHWRRRALPVVGLYLLVASGYAAGSQLSYSWFGATGPNAAFFPAAGVTLGALVLSRRRYWPVVLAAAATSELTLDLLHGIPLDATLGYVGANLVEPLTGALIVTTLVAGTPNLSRTRDLLAFLSGAVALAPAAGGAVGASVFVGLADGDGWARFAAEWWAGDGLGVLVVGGAIVSLRATTTRSLGGMRLLEGTLVAGACVATTIVVFWLDIFSLVYVPVVLLLVVGFRLGTRGVALTSAVVAIVAGEATAQGHVYWTELGISASTGSLYLQLTLGLVVISALAVAAEISGRERAVIGWARTEAARRESERTAARAERLRELASELTRASTREAVEVTAVAYEVGGAVDPEGAYAVRLVEDALERTRLLENERQARERAELLERHAAHIAFADSADAVASATVDDLRAFRFDAVGVFEQRGSTVRALASSGIAEETLRRIEGSAPQGGSAVAECLLTGQPVELATGDEYDARYPELADLRPRYPLESALALPLSDASGAVLGALFIGSVAPRTFDGRTRQLLVGIAQQSGLALEREQLSAEAEAAAADASFLVELSDSLERATSVERRARRLVDALVKEIASFAAVRVSDEEMETVVVAGQRPAALADDVLSTLLAGGRSPAGTRDADPQPLQLRLRARSRTIGTIVVVPAATPQGRGAARRRLPERVASRAAIALDNAMLFERERSISHELQLGLLGGRLLQADGVSLSAAYRPGAEALDVGGDWYDAFRLPSGALALVVGDVVGHGLEAAVAMGQLRGAVRALGATGSPAAVLAHLDTFVESLPETEMSTVAYVELEPDTGRVTYACAGHPPPLVLSPEGPSRFLWSGRSAPLGTMLGPPREEATAHLAVGETLLLYTDGLVERRGEGIDEGLNRLAAAAGGHPPGWATLVHDVADELLGDRTQNDDVCLLTVHRSPATVGFAHSFPADPSQLAELRRRLGAWLREREVTEDVAMSVVLAASEAAANSIEHGYAFDPSGTVDVRVRIDAGELVTEVRDRGTWQEAGPDGDRGRGIPIMEKVMTSVQVDRDGDGTLVQMRRQAREQSPA